MATLKLYLKKKKLANEEYPLYLRVTKDRKTKLISTGFSCEIAQWNENKSEFRKNCKDYVHKNAVLQNLKSRAEKIFSDALAKGEDISLSEFEELFFNFKKDKKISLLDFWNEKIENLIASKQVGNARAYRDTKNSFFNFIGGKKELFFKDITPELLNKYEVFLRSNGGTDGGISVKMRTIRALYNNAIEVGVANKENYPFNNYKISKLKAGNSKRAFEYDDVEKIKNLDLNQYFDLVDTRNYFIFSYYTRGMNFYDMMLLEWGNIQSDKIIYTRRKTKTSFSIKILEPVREILDYYRENKKNATKYVFPILTSDDLTPMQIEHRKDKILKKYNKELKRIAEICGIEAKITSYVARHSFATNLKQKGIATDIISEAMGHQNVAITQAYLKDLENSVIDDAMEKLL